MAYLKTLVCCLLLLHSHAPITSAVHFNAVVQDIWSFPVATWVENLAIRANGKILATLNFTHQVWLVDPDKREPAVLAATIPGHLGLAGITEVESDVFYVNANNFSVLDLTATPNASVVYRLDSSSSTYPAQPELVADFSADSVLLNGMTTFSAQKGLILVGDSGLGIVWLLNVFTGSKAIAAADPLMAVKYKKQTPLGVNGMKMHGNWLYFSNSNQQILARIQLNDDEFAKSAAQAVAHYAAPDDILPVGLLGHDGFLAAGNDELRFIDSRSGEVRVVSSDSLLEGSTAIRAGKGSARWSEGRSLKYFVTTNGGEEQYAEKNVTNPGKFVQLNLRR